MCTFYVGRPLIGSFKARLPVSNVKDYIVERNNNQLYLVKSESERIALLPIGTDSYDVMNNFSIDKGPDCKSIYRLEQVNDTIAVILYQYMSIIDLTLDSKKLIIHLRPEAEDQMNSSAGLSQIHVDSSDEIPGMLAELFITNRSIFVQSGKRGGMYKMIGDDCWAEIIMEKPGIYVIDSFHRKKSDKEQFGVIQIFGHILFMLHSDAIAEKGNNAATLPKPRINDVFYVWHQYMSFQMEKMRFQKAKYIFGYRSISVFNGQVSVELRDTLDLKPLNGIEFEYMPGKQFGYDPEHLPTATDLDVLTKNPKNETRYLGKILNEDSESMTLYFDMPRRGLLDASGGGILYLSSRSLEIEQKRRSGTLRLIEHGANRTINNILRLSQSDVNDIQVPGIKNPDNADVLKLMFGTDQVELTENYRHAMDVALNTPDIALIQGPPGTGKTTLIKGLLARLKQINENVKVLLSSEQHDAMYNLIDRFTDTGLMPPYVSSKRFNDDEEDIDNSFEKNVSKYQELCLNQCNKILQSRGTERVSVLAKQLTMLLIGIRESNYSQHSISESLPKIKDLVFRIGCGEEVICDLSQLEKYVAKHMVPGDSEINPLNELLLHKIRLQRTDIDVFFNDDGAINFKSLQDALKRQGQTDKLFPNEASVKLLSKDMGAVASVFKNYQLYVEQLMNAYMPTSSNEFDASDMKEYLDHIRKVVAQYLDHRDDDEVSIIEKFQYLMEDEEIVSSIVQKYTTVVGCTCAQAGRILDSTNQSPDSGELFDYVIVDEAARANPLDIMIPLALGKKVLLVGDHKQLPHYIESQEIQAFSKNYSNNESVKRDALTKPLFQIIYENLEIAKKEGRITAERVALIKEQHRMHPDICKFISDNFYDGELTSSENTKTHLNTYGVCNGKNIGFINVPFTEGAEVFKDNTYYRSPEAKKIIDLISEILSKNPEGNFTIGVITYYRGQVEVIKTLIKDTFMEQNQDKIFCGTVDTSQGKEFNIVILSGVRCNPNHNIGFIKSQPSRINVSFSRARDLMIMVCDVDTYIGSSSRDSDIFAKYFEYCRSVGYCV